MTLPVRIGVIDDEPDIRALLEVAARFDADADLGFVAATLAGGIDALRRTSVDVVLVDRRLPDGDALDHVAALRFVAGDARLVMLSAEMTFATREPALTVGLDGYLDKTSLAHITRTPLSHLVTRVTAPA